MKSWINPFCALWVSLAVCFSAQARDNSRYVNLFMGTDRYELFTPLFDRIVLHLPDHDVKLIRKCAPASAKAVTIDGRRLPGFTVTHAQLTSARQIVWLP